MKKCCEETFRRAINEVIIIINDKKITNVEQLLAILRFANSMMENDKNEKT